MIRFAWTTLYLSTQQVHAYRFKSDDADSPYSDDDDDYSSSKADTSLWHYSNKTVPDTSKTLSADARY